MLNIRVSNKSLSDSVTEMVLSLRISPWPLKGEIG